MSRISTREYDLSATVMSQEKEILRLKKIIGELTNKVVDYERELTRLEQYIETGLGLDS